MLRLGLDLRLSFSDLLPPLEHSQWKLNSTCLIGSYVSSKHAWSYIYQIWVLNLYIQYMNILKHGWIDFQTGLNDMRANKWSRFSVAVELKHDCVEKWKAVHPLKTITLLHDKSDTSTVIYITFTVRLKWSGSTVRRSTTSEDSSQNYQFEVQAWDGTLTKHNLILPARAFWYRFPLK